MHGRVMPAGGGGTPGSGLEGGPGRGEGSGTASKPAASQLLCACRPAVLHPPSIKRPGHVPSPFRSRWKFSPRQRASPGQPAQQRHLRARLGIAHPPTTPTRQIPKTRVRAPMSERGSFRGGGRGGGRGRGGASADRGGRGGGAAGNTGGGERKKENILDLNKYMDKAVTVKFSGGREGE